MDDYGNELPATTLQQVNKRFNQGSERMAAIERDLKAATQGLHEVRQELHQRNQQLAELLEFFTAMKGAFKVLNWLGKIAKPAGYIVALGTAVAGFWSALKGGKL